MGLNIGNNMSKYVVVRNITVRPNFSSKVLFADLVVSRKTGKPKVDTNTGEVATDKNGQPIPERFYQRFKAKFVGKATAKAIDTALVDGTAIDIIEGWLEQEKYTTKQGEEKVDIYCIISEYELSDNNKRG